MLYEILQDDWHDPKKSDVIYAWSHIYKWREEPQNKRNIIIFFFLQDYLAMWQFLKGERKK